jgi:hypothetical protein
LGTSVSNPILVFLFALSLPVFALVALFNTGWHIPESLTVTFHIALFSLPVLLLVKRGGKLLRISYRRKHLVLPLLIVLTVLTMIIQINMKLP